MFARAMLAAALMLTGCAPQVAPGSAATAPTGKAVAEACIGRDGWSDPAPPATIFANVHYVGTCGITALLVTSPEGHVLIDGATAEAAAGIAANIEKLGFKLGDVRLILTSHEHLDHVGGIAALQRSTGARLVAMDTASTALATGKMDPADPQTGLHPDFAAARVDVIVKDGDVVRLGPLAFTAHATPAHSPGSTSWTWASCGAGVCRKIAYIDSLTAVSADDYRFADHPARVAAFDAALTKVAALECDLLLTPHPGSSNLFDRFAGRAPLLDSASCRAYAAAGRQRLEARLAKEADATAQ